MPAWKENPSDSICSVPTSRWSRGLTFAWVARRTSGAENDMNCQDLVGRFACNSATSTGSWEMTQYGKAFRTNSSAEKLRFPPLGRVAWNFNGINYHSLFICMRVLDTAISASHMFSHAWGSGAGAWSINWQNSSTIRYLWHSGTSRSVSWSNSMPAVGTFATFLITRKPGGVHELYVNGVSFGQATSNFAYGSGSYDLVIGNETGANNTVYGDYYAAYVWRNRALEDSDAWALAADPWAPVRPNHGTGFLTSAAAPVTVKPWWYYEMLCRRRGAM